MKILKIINHLLPPLLVLVMVACKGSSGSADRSGSLETGPELITVCGQLDELLMENSGIIYFRDKIWTINDSGGDAVLFGVDIPSGRVTQAIYIEGAENRDWEDISQDEDNIYIGDTGNNFGRKEKLQVYIISKVEIPVAGNARLVPTVITYSYSDRVEEEEKFFTRSSFDCEAFFVWKESLYFFTKDWKNQTSTVYRCPVSPGDYLLHPISTLPVDGLVTAAEISVGGDFFLLLGYKDYIPFIWIYQGFEDGLPDPSRAVRLDFEDYIDQQTEGICIRDPENVFISCEMTRLPASLYKLDISGHLP